jgi:NAD dependent epimerase/dehydratase
MNWKNKKVAITGADGFIGSHLTETLAGLGAEVSALAQYNSFDSNGWLDDLVPEIKQVVRVIRGDVRDPAQMMSFCQGQDLVFHLAALISIPFSYDAPSSYIQTNVQGTNNVLQGALLAEVSRVIHTSTSEVYGTAQFTPITEAHPLQGQSPYSASKIGADMIAEAHFRSFDLPVITLRPFNTFGPRQSERAVLSTIIRQNLDERCDTVQLGDMTTRRDFNFVSDTVRAFLSLAEADDQYLGQTFNSGNGKTIEIGEALKIVFELTGAEKPVVQDENRIRPKNSEVLVLMADYSLLNQATGWHPEVDLRSGLGQTIDWWQGRIRAVRTDTGFVY